jgi:hypothetical protein
MASGHASRIKRPNTWLHRPMLQNVKKALANPEPSTHEHIAHSSWATSRSDSLLPSIRVEEPMLSIVATRRSAESRSGASVPNARHAPLNSSISAINARISGVIRRLSIMIVGSCTSKYTPVYT